ncbi:hypothetical protein MTO96_038133 [Rhipicephalus appendiculatus]
MSLYLIRAQETRETRGARPSPDRTRTFLLPSLPARINPIARTLAPSLSGAVEAAYLRAVPASRPVNGCSAASSSTCQSPQRGIYSRRSARRGPACVCIHGRRASSAGASNLQPLPTAVSSRAALIYARAHTPNASFSCLPNGRLVPGRNAGLRTGTHLA